MEPKFKIAEVFKTSWKAIKQNIWILTGLMVSYTIIALIINILLGPSISDTMNGITPSPGELSIYYGVAIIFSGLFNLGYIKNIFQALDGIEPQFSAYGAQAFKILKFIVGYILVVFICLIGLIFLVIPGIYLMLRLQFFMAFLVDENTGIIESLKKSWQITKGETLQLFLLMLVQMLVIIVGLLLFGIGIFVAYPVIYAMYCETYKKLNPLKPLKEVSTEE